MPAAEDQGPRLGRYIVKAYGEESVKAFVPPPLPPNPPVRLDELQVLLEQANQSLGRLDGLASVIPDLSLFIYAYVRKEAVLSSQIEGTQFPSPFGSSARSMGSFCRKGGEATNSPASSDRARTGSAVPALGPRSSFRHRRIRSSIA